MNSSKKTKSKIINSAIHLFAHFGFHGTSMNKIASGAGVNKVVIYYHFRSKDNLYRLVFQGSLKHTVKNIYSHLLKSRLKINKEKTEDILIQFWDANPLIMKLFIHELTSGAQELHHVLIRDRQMTHHTLQKLAAILSMLNGGDVSELDDKTIIRKAVQEVAHSMSSRLVDTAISAIFETQTK
jgi:AcrR family transcriptional regulator